MFSIHVLGPHQIRLSRKHSIYGGTMPLILRVAAPSNRQIKRYYQRKSARTNGIVAIKTVAHKLARACYYILRDHVPFDVNKAFV